MREAANWQRREPAVTRLARTARRCSGRKVCLRMCCSRQLQHTCPEARPNTRHVPGHPETGPSSPGQTRRTYIPTARSAPPAVPEEGGEAGQKRITAQINVHPETCAKPCAHALGMPYLPEVGPCDVSQVSGVRQRGRRRGGCGHGSCLRPTKTPQPPAPGLTVQLDW